MRAAAWTLLLQRPLQLFASLCNRADDRAVMYTFHIGNLAISKALTVVKP